ncbi:MAG: lipid A biosynthesis acyltransferase [Cardiobacteriaceae bacterium]|nr:lipid A biosynthesis acyltransferase [Cardiobacteriaceae bacterium]
MQAKKSFIHPRYLGHWLALGLLWLIVHLPGRMALGRFFGRLLLRLAPYRGRIIARNLALAFPELSEKARENLLRDAAENIGVGVIETGMAWFWSERALRRISRFSADPEALKLVQGGTPVVLCGSHNTLLELGVRLLSFYVPAAGMYRPQRDAFFDDMIYRKRRAIARDLVSFRDMRNTLRLLQEGENLWYALDQDMGERVSVFAPFFGIDVASVDILPQLHRRTGAQLVPVFMWREADGHYSVRLAAPIAVEGRDSVAIMGEFNALLEAEIRAHPGQYFWVHRRFKTLPGGGRRYYPRKDEK